MDDLVRSLKEKGVLKAPAIIDALQAVQRSGFVSPEFLEDSGQNEPLPIGYGQTISQPETVIFMLELLQVSERQRVLDVGAGSGWTAALLSQLVGPEETVYAVERIPQLRRFCHENLKRAGIRNVIVAAGDGAKGWPEHAPFDRIHVGAAASEIPPALIDQLAVGGRLVIPVGAYIQELRLIEKTGKRTLHEERFPGFQFVPLVTG